MVNKKLLAKHIATKLFIVLPMQLISAILLIGILPFIGEKDETLPAWCRWFDNGEIPLGRGSRDDGLAGPAYYRQPRLERLDKIFRSRRISLYILRYTWLALRNPVDYFRSRVVGFKTPSGGLVDYDVTHLDNEVGHHAWNHEGVSYLEVSFKGKTYFEYYRIYVYKGFVAKVLKFFTGKRHCARIRMGHRMEVPLKAGEWNKFTFTTIPFKEYEGE